VEEHRSDRPLPAHSSKTHALACGRSFEAHVGEDSEREGLEGESAACGQGEVRGTSQSRGGALLKVLLLGVELLGSALPLCRSLGQLLLQRGRPASRKHHGETTAQERRRKLARQQKDWLLILQQRSEQCMRARRWDLLSRSVSWSRRVASAASRSLLRRCTRIHMGVL